MQPFNPDRPEPTALQPILASEKSMIEDLWYKNTIIYSFDIETRWYRIGGLGHIIRSEKAEFKCNNNDRGEERENAS
jgi:hypothetical protein